jgi:hypothetical protein
MRTTVGAIFAVIVAVCLGACGSTQHAVTLSRTAVISAPKVRLALPSGANLFIVPPVSGTGDAQFGTFTASGTVYFEFSCKGKGPLTIVGVLSHISPCDGSPTGASVPYHSGERVHLTVQAKPGTTWRLAVGEHVPGAARLLFHRSGVGNKPIGTFVIGGRTLEFNIACKGTGNLTILFNQPFPNGIPDEGTVCPTPDEVIGTGTPGRKSRTARISVEADPNVRWTISLSSTPGR